MQQLSTPTIDLKSILASRRSPSIFGPQDVCYAKITTRKNFLSQQSRIFRCTVVGKDTFPQSLCVLANKIVSKVNLPNVIRSQCTFLIRNYYTEQEMKLTVCVPGTLEIVVYDAKLIQNPIHNKSTLSQLYISSILRYMLSLLQSIQGYYYDPFQKGYSSFEEFLTKLIQFEITYKKKAEINLNYQQMTRIMGNGLHMAALFISRMKMHMWLERFYRNHKNQIDHIPIVVQFMCEAFGLGGQDASLRQILLSQQFSPIWAYYASLGASKDQQVQVLKKLTYLNKTQIWLLLADSYINYHITNLTLVSKGLHILNILCEKKDNSIKHENPYNRKTNFNEAQQLSAISASMLPVAPATYGVKSKVKIDSTGIEQINELRELIHRYYSLSTLEKTIVKKLGFLIKEVGQQKTELLFPKVFQQEFRNEDPLHYEIRPTARRKSTVDSEEQWNLPSFVQTQRSNGQAHHHNVLSTVAVCLTQQSTKAQLWSITEENTTPRQRDVREIVRFDPVQYCKKKYSSKEFINLLEIALDVNENLRKTLNTLQIKPTQLSQLNTLKLSIQNTLILAQAAEIYQMIQTSILLYSNVKSRIFDLYSIWKVIKLSGRINQFNTQLLAINQLILDSSKYSKINLSTLPLWVEEHLFSTLKKKGSIFVEALLKSNNISQPAITKSLNKYTSLIVKESFKQ